MELKLPSLNAITRTISPSHGLFYSFDNHTNTNTKPVKLQEANLVGTLGIWKEQGTHKEQVFPAGIQKVDTCFLPPEHNAYSLKFNLRIVSLVDDAISNHKEVLAKFRQFVNNYRDNVGGEMLARRYLTNLINGRFLWRNKYADNMEIKITIDDESYLFSINPNFGFSSQFKNPKDQTMFDKWVTRTAQALFNKEKVMVIYIEATGVIGYGQEIYPSQEFVNDKNKSKSKSKKKVLFDVLSNNTRVAAFHSQKIGNAIRTIDTWYGDNNPPAIPVDPFGPDKKNQTLHRAGVSPSDNSIYSILNRLLNPKKTVEPDSNDGHYLMACFIRGGVYAGEKSNKK